MKNHDAIVSGLYRVKKCHYRPGWPNSHNSAQVFPNIWHNQVIVCISKNDDGSSDYRLKKEPYDIQKNVRYYSCLEVIDKNAKYQVPNSMSNSTREERLKLFEKEFNNVERCINNLVEIRDKFENKIDKLKRFKTDEEELAHTLSDIIKFGGDPQSILEILKKNDVFKSEIKVSGPDTSEISKEVAKTANINKRIRKLDID